VQKKKKNRIVNASILIDELMDCGVTYSSVTLLKENGETYLSKCSNDSWLSTYITSKLYLKCHLMQEAVKQLNNNVGSKGFVFIWDNYYPNNEESFYLEALRKENHICHGVAFCSRMENNCISIITVAGKSFDINFRHHVLSNKQTIYKAVMQSTFPG
jgi:hypothetical protein